MDRRHLILPAALLAGSALLAGRAALGSLPLGPDAQPSSNVGALVDADTSASGSDPLSVKSAQLDAAERRLDAIDAQAPPALPAVSAPSRGPGGGSFLPTASSTTSSGPSGDVRAADGHGGRGRDHAEDDGTVEDDDRFDDHGGDRDDDRSGHGRGGDDDDHDDDSDSGSDDD